MFILYLYESHDFTLKKKIVYQYVRCLGYTQGIMRQAALFSETRDKILRSENT